ncbi:phosphoenolpyruvate synthase [Acuticoccus sediminis]|uniref:Phosphoenolpyruvate synthase n=1 Tax=Acuticoccus sediminis TaxID=2184697 RepID=A0A8B2P614_9HYPH|nr:phosphoenolpyruvate synthase [Acuticoccus sediminis]RAI04522.1 phosphoenolpyruvate synthase [Acuticoccus sediminis]
MGNEAIVWLENARRGDVATVGGKNASLGEMIATLGAKGIEVPPGFATSSTAYRAFIAANALEPRIRSLLADLAARRGTLPDIARAIRQAIVAAPWPDPLAQTIVEAYEALCRRVGETNAAVAVRSSATAEDLADASFAGQQETFLNVSGPGALLDAVRRCFASLFTDRAIAYREAKGFDHLSVALSVGVQIMVRTDIGGSGVMFTIDPESGFDRVVVINAAWGLGETVVQGMVDPDEYVVFKPFLSDGTLVPIVEKRCGEKTVKMIYGTGTDRTRTVPTAKAERRRMVLCDEDILTLARWAVTIEEHYRCPMDIEWGRDGANGRLYIVQARPETVRSQEHDTALRTYRIKDKGRPLATGLAIGDQVVTGEVCLIEDVADQARFVDGAILVTRTTDPDWVPVMKRAAAIVTDHGGRTSHAAIVSRELGVPAIVGTGDATEHLHSGQTVTVSCAEGDTGFVYEGAATVAAETLTLTDLPATKTKVMLNLANPGAAFRWWRLPTDGVGLARMEFVIANRIRVHPMALVHFDAVEGEADRREIEALTQGYADRTEYFVTTLAQSLARIAAVVHPNRCLVRFSDFKTNEYAGLLGGKAFEPAEENPMIGFRGASRYANDAYRPAFALECRAIAMLRNRLGFTNVAVMVPFCRSVTEADKVLGVMAENGLKRGEDGLQVFVMAEIPSNVVLAKAFASRFDGFSIGSNDLTQLTLGVDRDSDILAPLFDENDDAVRWMIATVIREAHAAGAVIGLCGQAPSDHPEFAHFLVGEGIDSISVTPDSFLAVKKVVAEAEGAAARLRARA